MRTRTLFLIFAAAALVALVAFAPLGLVASGERLRKAGLGVRAVEGAIWTGALRGVSYRGDPVGDVRARIAPLGLLVGRPAIRFRATGQVEGGGIVQLGARARGLLEANLRMPSRMVAPRAPLDGQLVLQDFTAAFQDGRCRKAGGQARFEVSRVAGAPVQGLNLDGQAACDQGALVLPLSGAAQGARIEATLRLDGTGRYRLESRVMTTDANLGHALGLAGFERTLEGARRTDEGRIAEDADR